jgi:hypothetical protein
MTHDAQPARTAGDPNWIRIGAIVVLAIVVAVIVWLIVKDDNNNNDKKSGPPPASAATVGTLRTLPGQLGHPVYWAGTRTSYTYELTQVNGNVFIRYLPSGVSVGDPRPNFLTVGSYPGKSYGALKRQASKRGNRSASGPGGSTVFWSQDRPQSVYIIRPGSNIQVEVYDPSAARARRLATSGAVKQLR